MVNGGGQRMREERSFTLVFLFQQSMGNLITLHYNVRFIESQWTGRNGHHPNFDDFLERLKAVNLSVLMIT